MKKSLLSLAFGTFALGIVEFGIMGILSDIANDLNISIIKAGHLISAYSAGVAVGAPSLLFSKIYCRFAPWGIFRCRCHSLF